MKLKFLNVMVFAKDYQKQVDWYIRALGMEKVMETSEDYHYTELAKNGQVMLGFTPAEEIGHKPNIPRNNSTILQLEVGDIHGFFKHVEKEGGSIRFGVSVDAKSGLKYGAINDPEDNEIWVIEELFT